ncbi:cupin domain-containing protein [Paraburkholderia sp. J76]|uniref:cupin domain-containing protein n=1 Tax=Paraburkholderia sp. J76 TaxID=2805439 RepID=UPI002ABDEB89|nr:cupin domain-containing protein [Paraburkholderia sp. J76]
MHENRAFHFPRNLRESRPAQRESGVETFLLPEHGWVPNNARLPVIVYRRVLTPGAQDLAQAFNDRFEANGWPVQWHDGVFDYHHFHSTAHEVLGVFAGTAELILGGPGGRVVRVHAGDALLLPAGTGHCLLSLAGGFRVAGGYPRGQQWDIRRAALTPAELRAMQSLPYPASDPLYGKQGPLIEHWLAQA